MVHLDSYMLCVEECISERDLRKFKEGLRLHIKCLARM